MNDIHALSGAYAVDALDDLERARFDLHLARCAECRAEVAGLRETVALLAGSSAEAPAPEVRDRVLAQITKVRQAPPVLPVTSGRRRWAALLVAAAATILVIGLGAVVIQPGGPEQIAAVGRVLNARDVVGERAELPTGGTMTVVNSAASGRAVLMTRGLAEPPPGKTYELWLQAPDGVMHPAGLVEGGTQAVLLTGDSSTAVGAGITMEPAGGSQQPTTEPLAVFSFAGT